MSAEDASQIAGNQFIGGPPEENAGEITSAEELEEEIILSPPKGREFIVTTVPRNLPRNLPVIE